MSHKSGSKAYCDQQRERLARIGVGGRPLIEQIAADLMRCGRRPREAWRFAHELTQSEVATRFNQIRGDPDSRMRGSRSVSMKSGRWEASGRRCGHWRFWPLSIYEITWDRLVDVDDLEGMPDRDRQAFLDISDLRYGDSLELPVPRQRRPGLGAPHRGGGLPVTEASSERLPMPSPGGSSERSGGGLPGEITHFTGRDGPMAELRTRIAEQAPQGTVVSIYAIDGMAGVGKTAFARHAAQELAERYPDGAIWIELYGHTPGMQPRQPSGALEQMLLQLGVPPQAIKADLAERQDQWRQHIHAKRMLIVLDNVRTSDQVLPEAPGCLVLITSRRN